MEIGGEKMRKSDQQGEMSGSVEKSEQEPEKTDGEHIRHIPT